MSKRPRKPSAEAMAPAKTAITSLVKKDLKQIKDYATKINKSLKDPGLAAIRICECCVQVT